MSGPQTSNPSPAARRAWRTALLAAVTLESLAAPASAQAPTAPILLPTVAVQDSTPTDDRTTTGYVAKRSDVGTKTDTPLIETPQSISVVPKDQIQQQDAQTLNQALHYTAGVVTETRGGIATRYDQLTIRGFGADVYFNGLKLLNNGNYIIPQIDPELLERIDVLRGPSSVLYGQASAGGLIDQELKLPTTEASHEVGVEFGNFKHAQASYDFSGPIDPEGKWSYRIAGVGRTEDGQVSGTKNERVAVAPSLTFRPDADTTLTLYGLYQHDPRSTSYGSVPPQGTVLPSAFGTLPRNFYDGDRSFEKFDRTEVSLGTQFEHRFNEAVTLRSRAQWFHTDQSYASVYGSALEADGTTLDRGTALSRDSADQGNMDTSLEVRLHTGPLRHVLLAGFDYQHLSSQWDEGFGTAPSINIFAPDNNQLITPPSTTRTKAHLNQYGAYAQDQVSLGRFVLTLSGREDWAETYQSNASFGTRNDQFARNFSGRAGLTYVFDNGVAPYVSYAESFNPLLGNSEDGTAFKPETGRQYEVGVKYQPPGTRTLLTGALFDLTRNNLVTPDLENPLLSIQSGQARSRGAEIEARTSLTEHVDLVATYTYLDTVYTRDNSGLQGKRLPAIPQHAASAFVHYTFDAGPMDGVGIGGGARYTGSTFNDVNTFKVKDYVLVDGVVSYDLGRKFPRVTGATLYLNARNLLDEKYVASCYYGNWCAYGYGRQVMGGLRYHW